MRCLVMFITAVCLIFLLELKWPKNKSVVVVTNETNSETLIKVPEPNLA